MNEENTKKLLKDFPKLYKQYNLPMTQTCMCWGFDCKDGWFDLLYDLSLKLKKVSPNTEATQVKEKFGGLRFYYNGTTEEGSKLICDASEKSEHICEVCGKKGVLREDLGWVRTLCFKHYKEHVDPTYLLKKRKGAKTNE